MKVVCLGGGPSGLYFAISMKLRDPSHEIVVIERNEFDDTFGWGVVLSDDALSNMVENDAKSAEAIRDHFVYWDNIAVHHKCHHTVSDGHGFAGIGRRRMLILLRERAEELGVDLRYECEFGSAEDFKDEYDLVVACDGINSSVRGEYTDHFRPDIDVRDCKFIWLGTSQKFDDAFTFIFEETKHGWVWVHAYQFDDNTATVIAECTNETWEKFGFADSRRDIAHLRQGHYLQPAASVRHHDNARAARVYGRAARYR